MQEKSRIKSRILEYIAFKGISRYSFYKSTGITRGILDQDTGISEDNLSRFLAYAQDISPSWLLTGGGGMLKTAKAAGANLPEGQAKGKETGMEPKAQESLPFPAADAAAFGMIPIVDISAAAGAGALNPDCPAPGEYIMLPPHMVGKGVYHCIRIKGDSMAPTLLDGGYVVTRLLDRSEWRGIRDGHIHVVTDTEGRTYVKRLRNRLSDGGFVVCASDNPDKGTYGNFNLQESEIHNIWHVEWYLSAKMPDIHDTYYHKIQQLEDDVQEIRDWLKNHR